MKMNKRDPYTWAVVVATAALTLALGRPAVAGCTVTTVDRDKNGLPDLMIVGDLGQQAVHLDAYQDRTVLSLDCDGDGRYDHAAHGDLDHKLFGPFATYTVRLKGSPAGRADTVVMNVADTWSGQVRSFEEFGGGGNTKVTIGGPGALTASSRLIVAVGGAFGNDAVTLEIPRVDASELYFKTDLQDGSNSTSIVNSNSITSGAVVEANANLMGHHGGYKFSSTGLVDGTLDVTFDGGSNTDGADFGTALIAGQVGPRGRLRLKANLSIGNDTFAGTLSSLTIATGGEIHVDARGQAGNDGIMISGGSVKNSGLLDINLEGDDGDDTLRLSPGTITNRGTIRTRVDGGRGKDRISAPLTVGAASTTASRLDLFALGGPDDDKIDFKLANSGPNQQANYVGGLAIVDAGPGTDTCTLGGNGLAHSRNCEH